MNLLDRFLERVDFDGLQDFMEHYKINVPENFNFGYDVIDEMARIAPDQIALVWVNLKGEERTFSFSDIKYYSDKTANYLRSLGIGKGDVVMTMLKRHYEFWFISVALCKLGATIVPSTHLLTTKDLIYRNNAAGIKMIISTDSESVHQYIDESFDESPTLQHRLMVGESIGDGWLDFRAGMESASPDLERTVGIDSEHEMMLLYFTSGTTGMPKMAAHNFNYPLGHIATAKYWHDCRDGGLHLTVSDTGWAKAAWGKIYGQWISGTAIMVYDFDKFIPTDLLDIMSRYHITTFCAPPTIYRFLIREHMEDYDLSSLKHATSAGEPLNPEICNLFKEFTGLQIKESFGQSETTMIVGNFVWMDVKLGSMGLPNPAYDIALIDDSGRTVEQGIMGEICIRTDKVNPVGLFIGYYRDEPLTASVWHDGFYHTGDIAWRDEDGYYWYIGRADDVIKSSGYRIGPFEVESALLEHPAVLEAGISGVPDPVRGQIIKATIVLNKGYLPSDELIKELQDHVKTTTAPYKYPRIIEFVDELPKTISGKIRRKELREKGGN